MSGTTLSAEGRLATECGKVVEIASGQIILIVLPEGEGQIYLVIQLSADVLHYCCSEVAAQWWLVD